MPKPQKRNPETVAERRVRETAEERAILQRLINESGGLADPEQMHKEHTRLRRLHRE